MDESFRSTLDNSSEVRQNISTAFNSTSATTTTSTSSLGLTVSAEIAVSVGLFIFGIGSIANFVVLIVLVRARRHSSSSVHTLIENQSAMDLYTCVFGLITVVMMFTHGYKYNGNQILDGAICMLFEDTASTTF